MPPSRHQFGVALSKGWPAKDACEKVAERGEYSIT